MHLYFAASNIPVECASKVKSSHNDLQLGKTADRLKISVVGQQEASANLCKRREGEVGEVWAVDEGEGATSGCQVGRGEGGEGIGVKAHVTCDGGQRGHVDSADISEGHVGGALQIREFDLQVHGVGSKAQLVGDVLQVVDVDSAEVLVVVDIENPDLLQLNARQAVQLSVGNENVGCCRDTLRKVESLQRRQSDPVDLVATCERVELEIGEDSHALQTECATDGVQLVRCDGRKLGCIVALDIASDLLDAVERDGARGSGFDDNVSSPFLTVLKSRGIALILDGQCTRATTLCYSNTTVNIL